MGNGEDYPITKLVLLDSSWAQKLVYFFLWLCFTNLLECLERVSHHSDRIYLLIRSTLCINRVQHQRFLNKVTAELWKQKRELARDFSKLTRVTLSFDMYLSCGSSFHKTLILKFQTFLKSNLISNGIKDSIERVNSGLQRTSARLQWEGPGNSFSIKSPGFCFE